MKFQVTKTTQIYGLHGNKFKNLRLEPSGVYASGSTFEGDVRYLRLPSGFKEVVRIDKAGPRAYVSTMNVKASNYSYAEGDDCGCGSNVPCGTCSNAQPGDASCCTNMGCSGEATCEGMSAGPSGGRVMRKRKGSGARFSGAGGTGNCGEHKQYTCSYGCCDNDCCPKPKKSKASGKNAGSAAYENISELFSVASGDWGVQAGQVFQFGKQQNPYHLQGGEIEGLVETDSHMLDDEGDWVDATGGWDSDRDWVDAKGDRERSTSPCDGNGANTESCRGYCVMPGSCIRKSGTASVKASDGSIRKVVVGNPLRHFKRKKGKSSAKGVTGTRGKFGYDLKHNYSGDDDIYSVQPGVIAPFEAHNNPYAVSAGEIEGDDATMPESYEY